MTKKDLLIWLNSLDGITNKAIDYIETYFIDLENIWDVSRDEIFKTKLSDKLKKNIIEYRSLDYLDFLKQKIKQEEVTVLTREDDNFPERLTHIPDCPRILYTKGNPLEKREDMIAIVGSRRASSYGIDVTEKITAGLTDLGITVISGLAKGIDTLAHRTCVNNQKRNIAVLGCGVDVVYPKSNQVLYEKILEYGTIVSEFSIGEEPLRYNFPKRNRIISGMSLGIVVVEADKKSGSLITATHAGEQGREVFAVPGNINNVYSRGTNALIKDGAKMVLEIEDIIEEIVEFKDLKRVCKTDIDYSKLSEDEIKVLSCIEKEPLHADLICIKSGLNISNVYSIVTILEMKGIIKRLPNQIFTIV